MKKRLSICIPTFNRSTYLRETLDSILPQATKEIEVVVSDNASTDSTGELIRSIHGKFPNFVYFRWPKNMGPDENYQKVIDLASGDYCWFLGSDDQIRPRSVERVLSLIENVDILVFNRVNCDLDTMAERSQERFVLPRTFETLFHTSDRMQMKAFLCRCVSIGALFSYISSVVVRKKTWDQSPLDASYIGSAYSHSFRLLSAMKRGAVFRFSQDFLVNNRTGNDGFIDPAFPTKRPLIDLEGYSRLASDIFGDEPELHKALLGVLFLECKKTLHLSKLINLRSMSNRQQWLELVRGYHRIFGPDFFILAITLLPPKIAKGLVIWGRKLRFIRQERTSSHE